MQDLLVPMQMVRKNFLYSLSEDFEKISFLRRSLSRSLDFTNTQILIDWMTQGLFIDWIQRFNKYIECSPKRKMVLFFDNCSAHSTLTLLPSLSNVEVEFLPPNTLSLIQHMDASIIAALKAAYLERISYQILTSSTLTLKMCTTWTY